MHPITVLFLAQAADDERERWLRRRRLAQTVAPRRPAAPRGNVWSLILNVRRFGLAPGS